MKHKTLFLVILLSISMIQIQTTVKAQTDTEPLEASLGSNLSTITEGSEVWYQLPATLGNHGFSLMGPDGTDFDIFLYDDNKVLIEESRESTYPEAFDYFVTKNVTLFIKVLSFTGGGEFNLTILHDEIDVLSPGLEQGKFSETNNIHFFQLNITGGVKNITLLTETSSYHQISLYDENMTLLDDSYQYYRSEILFLARNQSTYFLKLDSRGTPGVYDLYLEDAAIEILTPGTYSANLEYSESISYYLNMQDALYYFSLEADIETTDFDMDLYSLDGEYLTSAGSETYPEFMSYRSYYNTIAELTIDSFSGGGEFNLTITEILNQEVPNDYSQINENTGIDIYTLSGVEGENIDLELEMIGEIFYVAILDSPLDIHIITSLITIVDSELNPHNLMDSYTDFVGTYGTHQINYTSNIDTVYIAVYSLTMMTGYTNGLNHGYKLSSNHQLTLSEMTSNYEDYYPYEKSGTLSDNGDEYWDDGEFIIYSDITVPSTETFDMVISAPNTADEIVFILMDGTTEEDINDALQAFYDYYTYGSELPSGIYAASVTTDGLGYLSYAPSNSITFNLAIFFDLPYWETSASYSMFMSHESTGSVHSNANSANFMFLSGILALVPLVVLFRQRK